MQILGIDCGSNATGYGIITSDGRRNERISSGVIRPRKGQPMPERLRHISSELRKLITSHQLDAVAVEGIFFSVNARSALILGQVRGVALLMAAEAGLSIHEYSPLQVKSSVVGYGQAEKAQVQEMVKVLLRLDHHPPEDAADALAVAICHSHHCLPLARAATAALAVPRSRRSQTFRT
jgi:crossover junction endodeoxyribonuclease RuvC